MTTAQVAQHETSRTERPPTLIDHRVRRFRGAAIAWLYRAAGIDIKTQRATPRWLAHNLFTQIVTDDEDGVIESLRTFCSGSIGTCSYWGGWRFFLAKPEDPLIYGWACGQLACSVLRHRLFRHVPWTDGGDERIAIEYKVASAIGAELTRMWDEREPAS